MEISSSIQMEYTLGVTTRYLGCEIDIKIKPEHQITPILLTIHRKPWVHWSETNSPWHEIRLG